jgi:hypothetical protein
MLIGMTTVSSLLPAVTPSQLNPGMQTSAIPLSLNAGKTVDKGSRYTVKVVSAQTKQQIGSILLVAR